MKKVIFRHKELGTWLQVSRNEANWITDYCFVEDINEASIIENELPKFVVNRVEPIEVEVTITIL